MHNVYQKRICLEDQATQGCIDEAIRGFTDAKRWDPRLTFDPVAKANPLAAEAKSAKCPATAG